MGDFFFEGFDGDFYTTRIDKQVGSFQPNESGVGGLMNLVVECDPAAIGCGIRDLNFPGFIGVEGGAGREGIFCCVVI